MVAMFKSSLAGATTHTTSIDLQAGGYNPHFVRVSSIVGVLGIFASFVGFLGLYDDKPNWLRWFLRYMYLMVFSNIVVFLADVYTLSKCDGFADLPEDQREGNAALLELSSHNLCHWGRIAYYLGFAIQTVIDLYMLYNVWKYTSQLDLNPPYPIDFGYEKYDAASRWKFYEVAEPEEIPMFTKEEDYGSNNANEDDSFQEMYGPDGVKAKPSFSPDGMRGPAYIRAFR